MMGFPDHAMYPKFRNSHGDKDDKELDAGVPYIFRQAFLSPVNFELS